MIPPLLFLALAGLSYALVSARLATTVVTAPIFFTGLGLLAGPALGLVHLAPDDELLIQFLEAALGMVLFADACLLDPRRFRREAMLSGRLLAIGMPLAILAGTLVAIALWPDAAPWQAALLATMLAPTDAAIGQAVVGNPRVPAVVRNALNVESGVNDGLALPLILIFIALGFVAGGLETEVRAAQTIAVGLVGSVVTGLLVGVAGGWLLREAVRRGLATRAWQSIALVTIAVSAFVVADRLEASGFLAVWIAGLAAGMLVRPVVAHEVFELPEGLAQALVAVAFLLLGAALLGPALGRITPQAVVYAVLSLTVVRLLPVAIAMARSGFARATVLYVGWFGPRGLATVVFAGVIVAQAVPAASEISDVALVTVALSIVAHGVTAAWGARRYASWFEEASAGHPGMLEAAEVAPLAAYRRGSLENLAVDR
ncbi:MAG TPA: cation:proton antiporter [Candidatus Nanopelagicales bacterium]|nr:cation:proton antiporter [Candidatus Nanopelagicales bacterium]